MTETSCIFCRIVAGELPAVLVHQDREVVAFRDIDPRAPVHILVVPRQHIASIANMGDADGSIIGRLFVVARTVAADAGLAESGYRLVINSGPDAGQTVDHVHLHVLGGRPLKWPPG